MPREQAVIDSFVVLADTLVDQFDVIDFLQDLSERCVDLLEVSAAGIMLADPNGALRHSACSSEKMRLVELFELQLEQGPCFDAFRQAAAVVCGSPETMQERWPEFAVGAGEAGFVSVSAVPMRLRTQVIGALNLFSSTPGALSDGDVRLAQAMADIATIGILQERAIRDANLLTSQLDEALRSRIVIEQAKGIVAEQQGIDVDAAFQLVRAYARRRSQLLSQICQQLVAGTLRPDELTGERTSPDSKRA